VLTSDYCGIEVVCRPVWADDLNAVSAVNFFMLICFFDALASGKGEYFVFHSCSSVAED